MRIGDHVIVYNVIDVEREGDFEKGTFKRRLKRVAVKPFHAVITGMRRLYTGRAKVYKEDLGIVWDKGRNLEVPVPVFEQEKAVKLFAVRVGWLNREILVDENDIQVVDEAEGIPLRSRLPSVGRKPERLVKDGDL